MQHDSLRQIRSHFYVGQYNQCREEAREFASTSNDPTANVFADVFAHRALSFVDPKAAMAKINASASTALQAIKEYTRYRVSPDEHARAAIVETLMEWKSNEMTGSDVTLTILLASILIDERRFKEALPLIANDTENLEKLSLCVIAYLAMDRHELAAKCVKALTDLDDDDVLTQLASAWLFLLSPYQDSTTHSAKVIEAESIVQGLSETFPQSPRLLTLLGVCELHKHNYTDAFRLLRQAKDTSKEGQVIGDDILLNSIVAVQHTGSAKSEELITAIKAELKTDGEYAWYRDAADKRSEAFDKHAVNYKWTQ